MIKLWSIKKLAFSILILLSAFHNIAAAQSPARELAGTVFSEDSITPLGRVTIMNKRSLELTVSNPIGNFKIQVEEKDTLLVTSIGFAPIGIAVSTLIADNAGRVRIFMKSAVYVLKPIDFTIKRVPKTDHEYYQRIFSRPKPTISSPISALYERYSKRGKELRKLESDYREYEYLKLEMRRFRNAVYPVMTNELEIIRLIEHCKLARYFVINAIDYDFNFAVRECMKTFAGSGKEQ